MIVVIVAYVMFGPFRGDIVLWRVGDLLRFRYVRVSGTFIMMTVILSLTGPIEHGQEERQAIEAGTGGVSPVGQEPPSTSIS